MTPPAAPRPAATMAFDRLAPRYDALADGEIFRLLRRRTHDVFASRLSRGLRVLEVGCGTGLDTAFLAGLGVHVVACDPSEEMVSRALRRLAQAGHAERATVVPCGLQDLAAYLEALVAPDAGPPARFDGIISNFGALNCVECLAPLGAVAHRYLKPAGLVLLGLMSPVCAVEALYRATRRPELAGRRRPGGPVAVPVAGIDVPTFYHRTADVRATLGPELRLTRIHGIGVVVPPPYLEARWTRLSPLVRGVVARLDAALAPWPPFNRVGDHVLLQFVKTGAARA